jgi:hypothetical protein
MVGIEHPLRFFLRFPPPVSPWLSSIPVKSSQQEGTHNHARSESEMAPSWPASIGPSLVGSSIRGYGLYLLLIWLGQYRKRSSGKMRVGYGLALLGLFGAAVVFELAEMRWRVIFDDPLLHTSGNWNEDVL